MARFLFTSWPFAGHLHPALAIAHHLQASGHQVGFYSGGSAKALVEREGFRFFPFKNVDEERIQKLVSSEFPYCPTLSSKLRNAKVLRNKFREWLLDTIPQQLADLDAILPEWQPDVLISDSSFWAPILVLHEAKKIPVAVLSISAACMLPGPQTPAWGPGTPLPRSWISHQKNRLASTIIRLLSRGIRDQVNALRKRAQLLPLSCSVTEFAARMPLYLVPSTPEYDYNRTDLPGTVYYIGPCLWDKPRDTPAPVWLSQLPAGEPLIYVTEATIGKEEPFLLQAAAIAFRERPVQVVMTSGRQRNAAEVNIGRPTPNIRVESYIPQSDLLPKAAVMVTLGGSGGVLAALKAGVPLVIVPNDWDRPENAQRVVEAGAGLRIAVHECTPERLRAAVERLLTEPSFKENAQRLSRAFQGYGADRAVGLLEELATHRGAHPVFSSTGFSPQSLVSHTGSAGVL